MFQRGYRLSTLDRHQTKIDIFIAIAHLTTDTMVKV